MAQLHPATVDMRFAARTDISEWLKALKKKENPPGHEQLRVLWMILHRCLLEAREFRTSSINKSDDEPLRHMIQGLPGAGKSELIKWIRKAFEEVFGFRHGVHYVCLASQNTMASLMNGFTNHS